MRLFPAKLQWKGWSDPSKWTLIGAYVGILALGVGIVSLVLMFVLPSNQRDQIQQTASGSNSPNIAGIQQSTGQNSPNVVANNSSITINYYYAAPTSPEGKRISVSLAEKLRNSQAELLEKYPYGFTMLGVRGGMFTTLDLENTNAVFQVDGRTAVLNVYRTNNLVEVHYTVNKVREFSIPSLPGAGFSAAWATDRISLARTDALCSPCLMPGVQSCIEVVDKNPDAPIVAIGFKHTDLADPLSIIKPAKNVPPLREK